MDMLALMAISIIIIIIGDDSYQQQSSSDDNNDHAICVYVNDRFSSNLLTIGYHRRDDHLWIISDDSILHRLSSSLKITTTIAMENITKWNHIDSIEMEKNWPSLTLNNVKRIILMSSTMDSNDYFILINNEYINNNIIVYDLDDHKPIWIINQTLDDYQMFMNGEIIMDIDHNRLLIINKFEYHLIGMKLKSSPSTILLLKNGSIQCQSDNNTNGPFCHMLSTRIVMNFFDGNQWNFVDQNGRLYQIEKHHFDEQSLPYMANIATVKSYIRTIFKYFECNDYERNKKSTINGLDNKTNVMIMIGIAIAIVLQMIVLLILFIWCYWYRKRRKQRQQLLQFKKRSKEEERSFSLKKTPKSKMAKSPFKAILEPQTLSPFLSTTTTSYQQYGSTPSITLSSKQMMGDEFCSQTETFREITEKSISKSSKKKTIIPNKKWWSKRSQSPPKQKQPLLSLGDEKTRKQKIELIEIIDEPMKTMPVLPKMTNTAVAITLSDYFGGGGGNKKPATIDKKTMETSERRNRSPPTLSPGHRDRNRHLERKLSKEKEDSLNEIKKNRIDDIKVKQRRRERQLIKVIKLLAKDSNDLRQQRRRLRGNYVDDVDDDDVDNDFEQTRTTTERRTLTSSREQTDPELVRDLLNNLDRHRERKRRRQLQQQKQNKK